MLYGLTAPVQWFSMIARLHMMEFGTRQEHLGAVAIAQRKHAALNPAALLRDKPLDMDGYLSAPVISDPYRLYDCSRGGRRHRKGPMGHRAERLGTAARL